VVPLSSCHTKCSFGRPYSQTCVWDESKKYLNSKKGTTIYSNISATVQARESRQIADIRELQAIICLPFTAFEPDLLHN